MDKRYCFICGKRLETATCITCKSKITVVGSKIRVKDHKVICLCGSNAFRFKSTKKVSAYIYESDYVCCDCNNKIIFTTHKKTYKSDGTSL